MPQDFNSCQFVMHAWATGAGVSAFDNSLQNFSFASCLLWVRF